MRTQRVINDIAGTASGRTFPMVNIHQTFILSAKLDLFDWSLLSGLLALGT